MKSIYVLTLIIFSFIITLGQSENNPPEFNFGFEKVTANEKLPDKWVPFGPVGAYSLKIDNAEKKSGNNSILIELSAEKIENSFGAVAFIIPANYAGKEIELRGSLKLKNVSDGFAGLWLRIDGDAGVLQFDNMQSRQIKGSADWTQY